MNNAIKKRQQFLNTVISITGTNGKTTTCNILYNIIKKFTTIDKTENDSNSSDGIPWCINKYFNLESKYWLCEIGIGSPNQMKKLVDLVKPHIRILTSIGNAHTVFFNKISDYQNEKLNYITNVPLNSVLIINNDDKILSEYINNNIFIQYCINNNIKLIKCGSNPKDDIQLISYEINTNNITSNIHIISKGKDNEIYSYNIILKGIGRHYAIDICLAIACANYLNIPVPIIRKQVGIITLEETRGRIFINKKITLYNYSYNGNPSSIMMNLKEFKDIKSNNKLIILGNALDILDSKMNDTIILDYSLSITHNIFVNGDKNVDLYNNKCVYIHPSIFMVCNAIKKCIILNSNTMLYIFIQGSGRKMIEIAKYIQEINYNIF